MAWYWWVLLIGIAYLFFKGRQKRRFGGMDDREISVVNPWFREHGIEPNTVTYSTYVDQGILGEGVEKLIVGFGYSDGEPIGFWAETAPGRLIEAHEISPSAASYHKTCAQEARFEATLLKHKLTERSLKSRF